MVEVLRHKFPHIVISVFILSLTIANIAYTAAQSAPLSSGLLGGLTKISLSASAASVTIWLGGAIGQRLLPNLTPLSDEERVALRALVGLSVIALVILIAGMLGGFPSRWLAWAIVLSALAVLHRAAVSWSRDVLDVMRRAVAPTNDPWVRWLRRIALTILVLVLVLALAPPFKWDALMYHLSGGRFYLSQGGIVSAPHNYRLSHPALTIILYTWLQILAPPSAVALLHGLVGTTALLVLFGGVARLGWSDAPPSTRHCAAWVAVTLILTSETVALSFSWPYNDLVTTSYSITALTLLLTWIRDPQERWLVLAGVCIGAMLGTRYTAYSSAVGLGLLTLWGARYKGISTLLRAGSIVTGAALITFAPWLIKNWILDNNPLAPVLGISPAFDALDVAYQGARQAAGVGPVNALLLPVQISVFGLEPHNPFQTKVGPLLFGLTPLAALYWRRRTISERSLVTQLVVFAIFPILAWVGGALMTESLARGRYLFPLFPALAWIGARGLMGLPRQASEALVRRIAFGSLTLMLTITLINVGAVFVRTAPVPVLIGAQEEDAYLSMQLPAYYAATQRIKNLPAGSRVLLLWEPRGFYCLPRCVADDTLNTWWKARRQMDNTEKIADHWREAGYTHILIHEAGSRFLIEADQGDPISEADWAALADFRTSQLDEIWTILDAYTLYALR